MRFRLFSRRSNMGRGIAAAREHSNGNGDGFAASIESLEDRTLLSAILRPDHIVIVVEQDRASNAIGDRVYMPYFNQVADTGLVYSNSHGVTHPTQPNMLAMYSGSTQGITDNNQGYSFSGPNLAKSLFDAGFTFSGFAENLPYDGSQANWSPGDATGATYPDLYMRTTNPMAMFSDVGIDAATGQPRPNSAVSRTFSAFSSLPITDYSSLPTVSIIIPNCLHSTHGSNNAYPWAGSSDVDNNNLLRQYADSWLQANLDPYLQWARTHNSLLIVTQDEERWTGGTADTITTMVNGDPRLFVAGTNPNYINHFNLLRTIEDMYGLAPLGQSATAAPFDANAAGQLSSQATTKADTTTALAASSTGSVYSEPVTLTAAVTSSISGAITGTITFKDGTTVLGTVALDATGQAAFKASALAVGNHNFTASYSGSAAYTASTSAPLAFVVQRAATAVVVSSSANPSAPGKSVTFTARVSPVAPSTAQPTGSVIFYVDGVASGAAVNLISGAATKSISTLSIGYHKITVAYAGTTNFVPSTSSALNQLVGAPNDAFANRIAIVGNTITVGGSNLGATKESLEPKHAGNRGGKSVWWTWTAPASGSVTIDTLGSNFDTLLAVYTGSAVSALTAVASNNDAAGAGKTSRVTFNAVAGRVYQIAVDGKDGASGAITLNVRMATLTAATAALRPATQTTSGGTAFLRTDSALW